MTEHVYTPTRRARNFELLLTGILTCWAVVAGYLWLADQASWTPFVGALFIMILSGLKNYSTSPPRLILSVDGIRYVANGASYFVPWDQVQFKKKNWRQPAGMVPSHRILPEQMTTFGRIMGALPIAFVPLRPFGWPSEPLRADIERFAPHLLAENVD
jgi:hypothetical protein